MAGSAHLFLGVWVLLHMVLFALGFVNVGQEGSVSSQSDRVFLWVVQYRLKGKIAGQKRCLT